MFVFTAFYPFTNPISSQTEPYFQPTLKRSVCMLWNNEAHLYKCDFAGRADRRTLPPLLERSDFMKVWMLSQNDDKWIIKLCSVRQASTILFRLEGRWVSGQAGSAQATAHQAYRTVIAHTNEMISTKAKLPLSEIVIHDLKRGGQISRSIFITADSDMKKILTWL